MIALTHHPVLVVFCALIWVLIACLLPRLAPDRQHRARWSLVFCGVPVLGWLTLLCGPGFGMLFLAVGLSVLVWPPLEWRRRSRFGTR